MMVDFDPLAAERGAAADPNPDAKAAAAAVIWRWYYEHGLHLPTRLEGQLRDDLEAFAMLVRDGMPEALRVEILSSLGEADAPRRGSAVAALAAAQDRASLEPVLEGLLGDVDPVVRRRAA